MDQMKIEESLRRKQIKREFSPPVEWRVTKFLAIPSHTPPMCGDSDDMTVLNDFRLMTILTEVEALVNSRPLTRVSDDINDLEALTPNHFIMGKASSVTCVTYDGNITPRRRWKQVQATADQFWGRWRLEYLPTLTKRNKWWSTTKKNVQVGNLVLILEESLVRGKWSLGRITQTWPGRDSIIRKVEVLKKGGRYGTYVL